MRLVDRIARVSPRDIELRGRARLHLEPGAHALTLEVPSTEDPDAVQVYCVQGEARIEAVSSRPCTAPPDHGPKRSKPEIGRALGAIELDADALVARIDALARPQPRPRAVLRPAQVIVTLHVETGGEVELDVRLPAGWATWRPLLRCRPTDGGVEWSAEAELWTDADVDLTDHALELTTRAEGPKDPAPSAPDIPEIPLEALPSVTVLATDRGRKRMDIAADHPDAARLLDPEPRDAFGLDLELEGAPPVEDVDGRWRSVLARAPAPAPTHCRIVGGRGPVAVWDAPSPFEFAWPRAPLTVEAGVEARHGVDVWCRDQGVELWDDPRISAERWVELTEEPGRVEVEVVVEVRDLRASGAPLHIEIDEPLPRPIDDLTRLELLDLSPRDAAADQDRGAVTFDVETGPGDTAEARLRYAVVTPTDHHAVAVPEVRGR